MKTEEWKRYHRNTGEPMRLGANHKQAGTHIPTLLKLIPKTTGDVCEIGAGVYSTPILHWLCQGRTLVTYENNEAYLHYARKFQSNNHRIKPMLDVDFDKHWSVVFIDHTLRGRRYHDRDTMDRGDDVLLFKDADIFVLHDSEPMEGDKYKYEQLWPKFKYRYDWKECKPWTTTLSNKIDVTKWLS